MFIDCSVSQDRLLVVVSQSSDYDALGEFRIGLVRISTIFIIRITDTSVYLEFS